jgi:putative spermidine/putrescine transport system substrate-binding protein
MSQKAPHPTSRISRRSFVGGVSATLSIGLPPTASAQSKSFVSTVFGGAYEQAYRKAIVAPFEKEFGAKVLLKLGLSGEWLTNAVMHRAAPEIDLLLLPYPDNVRASMEGIGMPLTAADIPNIKDIAPIWFDQFDRTGIGLDYVGYGIAYRSDLVPTAPTSWKDLWNPAYKGKVIIPQIGGWGSWEMLVVAARQRGGSEDNMAPAFEALRELKPNVRQFFKSGVDVVNLLSSGEAWVCGMTTNIAAYSLIDAGKPVKFLYPSEGAMVGAVSYHIAKGSQNVDICRQFINFALSKPIQEAFCNAVVAAPTNIHAVIDAKTRERVPEHDKLQLFSWAKIIPQMQALTDRWNQVVGF